MHLGSGLSSPQSVIPSEARLAFLKHIKDIWLAKECHDLIVISCQAKKKAMNDSTPEFMRLTLIRGQTTELEIKLGRITVISNSNSGSHLIGKMYLHKQTERKYFGGK